MADADMILIPTILVLGRGAGGLFKARLEGGSIMRRRPRARRGPPRAVRRSVHHFMVGRWVGERVGGWVGGSLSPCTRVEGERELERDHVPSTFRIRIPPCPRWLAPPQQLENQMAAAEMER